MTNHVHLLVTPESPWSLPKTMQAVGGRFVRYFNDRYERTGTLWEGRYRATAIEDEHYLLTCMRYIELNPVRANIVASPAAYQWSSYHANGVGISDPLVKSQDLWIALGGHESDRRAAYRALFEETMSSNALSTIRDATNKGWALGPKDFNDRIESVTRRRCAPVPRGRRRGKNGV